MKKTLTRMKISRAQKIKHEFQQYKFKLDLERKAAMKRAETVKKSICIHKAIARLYMKKHKTQISFKL